MPKCMKRIFLLLTFHLHSYKNDAAEEEGKKTTFQFMEHENENGNTFFL